MLQLGVQIKKPVQWVSVRNWDKMKKSKSVNTNVNTSRKPNSNKGFTL